MNNWVKDFYTEYEISSEMLIFSDHFEIKMEI